MEKHTLEERIAAALREDDRYISSCTFVDERLEYTDLTGIEFRDIHFEACVFVECVLNRTSFYNCVFTRCDFSHCTLEESYFCDTRINNCKGDGAVFLNSRFKKCLMKESSFRYGNFSQTRWESCSLEHCVLRDAFCSEVKFKKMKLDEVQFSGTDFFRTPLKGLDFSRCQIEGIQVSDTFSELKGMKISSVQALDLVQVLGVIMVD